MDSVKHEYVGKEKLSNLSKTTITHEDGTETIVTYRDKMGGELMGSKSVEPKNVSKPKVEVVKKKSVIEKIKGLVKRKK